MKLSQNNKIKSINNKTSKTSRQELFRALKFLLFSISAGIIQILSFELLYDAIHWIWWPSYLISVVLSVVWNFTFNRKFTFKSANNVPIAMAWTLLYYVVFIPISVFGGRALEDIGWNGTLVTFINMVINFVTEFLWQRYFVFRKTIDTKPIAKTYHMKLNGKSFEAFVLNDKKVEMRLYDEKRKKLKVGDFIVFSNIDFPERKIKARITDLKKYKDFEELYSVYDKTDLGYKKDETADPNDMKKIYNDSQIENGVLAIGIEVLKIKQ